MCFLELTINLELEITAIIQHYIKYFGCLLNDTIEMVTKKGKMFHFLLPLQHC